LRLAAAPIVLLMMLAYRLGLIGRDRLKTAMWAVLLGRAHPGGLSAAVEDFTRYTLAHNIRPGARDQIGGDGHDGALLVLATAAHELYARPIAEALGFDAVVATRAVCADDGRIGPGLAAANCYGQAKLLALERFLEESGIERRDAVIAFYSDSSSDSPVFTWCDRPVAVNPSRKLARLAARRNWAVTDWGRARAA
jgi:HAD superfamily phosphoserine phosphatase-like hydrolase